MVFRYSCLHSAFIQLKKKPFFFLAGLRRKERKEEKKSFIIYKIEKSVVCMLGHCETTHPAYWEKFGISDEQVSHSGRNPSSLLDAKVSNNPLLRHSRSRIFITEGTLEDVFGRPRSDINILSAVLQGTFDLSRWDPFFKINTNLFTTRSFLSFRNWKIDILASRHCESRQGRNQTDVSTQTNSPPNRNHPQLE